MRNEKEKLYMNENGKQKTYQKHNGEKDKNTKAKLKQ